MTMLPAALTVDASYDLLVTFLLVMGRILAFLVIAPPFNSRSVNMRAKGTLAAAMALAVTPTVAGSASFPDMGTLVWATVYHVGTGAVMGYLMLMLFSAVQAAGDLIDLFSMFTMSQLFDPMSNSSSGVFGRIQNLVGLTLLFASGGHLLVLRGVVTSFEVLPVHAPSLGQVAEKLVHNLDVFFVSALEISGPVLVVLVLADLALGLVSRAVPSLNIFQLSFPVKTILTVALASVAVSLLPGAVALLMGRVVTDMAPLSRLLGG